MVPWKKNPSSFPSRRQHPAPAVIALSSDSDEAPTRPRRKRPSSSAFPVIDVPSSDSDDEATTAARPRRRRPSPPSSSVFPARFVIDVPSDCDKATIRPMAARPTSAFPARFVIDVPSDGNEPTIRPMAVRPLSRSRLDSMAYKYDKWIVEDECAVLTTMAYLRNRNSGVIPKASQVLEELRKERKLSCRRCRLHVAQLSDKVYKLKLKFAATTVAVVLNGGKIWRRNKYRTRKLYKVSQDVWPGVFEAARTAAMEHMAAVLSDDDEDDSD